MTLDKNDWKQLDKRFRKIDERFEKHDTKIVSDVNKLLVRQSIRLEGKMIELEEKFEKHTTKLKSDFLEKIDPILKEITTAREERPLIESRIKTLEDALQQGKSALSS